MLPTGNYNGYAFRDDPRGFRKKNGLARGLSKHAPLIAILLTLLLAGGGLLVGWRLRRVTGDLRKSVAEVTDLTARLKAAQAAGDSNRDLAAQRYRQVESLSDSLFRVKGDLQEKNRQLDERDLRIGELQHEVAELKRQVDTAMHAHGENANQKSELDLLRSRMDILMNAASERDRQLSELQRRYDTELALHRRREMDWDTHRQQLEEQVGQLTGNQHLSPAAWAEHAKQFATNDVHNPHTGQPHQPGYDAHAVHPAHGDVVTQTGARSVGHDGHVGAGGGAPPHQGELHPDHAGFVTVAELLDAQGISDPNGVQHFAATLAKFFEEQMAAMMFKVESGASVRDTPSHEISTMLVTLLGEQGVVSAHGTQHMFATVDHLVDAALTHWSPPPPTPGETTAGAHDTPTHFGSAGHHAATPGSSYDAGHHVDPHAHHVEPLPHHTDHQYVDLHAGQQHQQHQQHPDPHQVHHQPIHDYPDYVHEHHDAQQQHQQHQYHDAHQVHHEQHVDFPDPHQQHHQEPQAQYNAQNQQHQQHQQQHQQSYDDRAYQDQHAAQHGTGHVAPGGDLHAVPATHYGTAGHVPVHDAAGRKGFGDSGSNPGAGAGANPGDSHQQPHKPDSAGFVL